MVEGVDFTKNFACINSKCSYNCCGGWQIEIDDATYHKYLEEKGPLGRELRRNICVRNVPQIKQRFGRCPYLTKDKLCGMYLTHGEEYMSFACRNFPRRKIDYIEKGEVKRSELYLELSCPEAARLFLEEKGFLQFEPIERKTDTCWWFEIEEEDYFEKLLHMRDIIEVLMKREDIPLADCLLMVFDYAEACQQMAMRLQYEEMIPFGEKYVEDERLEARLMEYNSYQSSSSEKGRLFHKFISEGVEQIDIKLTNPKMAGLLKLYYRNFKGKSYSEVGMLIGKMQEEMLHTYPEFERKYRNYFIYYVHQRLLYAIQSYNMTKPVIMGIVHTQMLLLFDLLLWSRGDKKLSIHEQMEALACYSRTAGHNEAVCDKLYDFIIKSKDMRGILIDLMGL